MDTGLKQTTVTIGNGASVSGAANLQGRRLVGFLTPATLTNSAFDVQGSLDGGTNWYDISSLQSVSAPTSTIVSISPIDSVCAQYVRLQGAGAEGGARTIILLSMPVV